MIGGGPAGVPGAPAGRWRRSVVVLLAAGGVACGGSGEPASPTTSDIEESGSVTPDASPSPTGAGTEQPPSPLGTTSPTAPSPSLPPPKDLPATPETDKPHAPG